MRPLFRSWSLGILLSLAHAPAFAAFEDLGAGARAPGMGGAFTAIADDVYASHYNAAGLGTLERPELGLTYARLYWGLSDGSSLGQSNLTYAHPLRAGRWGTLGVGWQDFRLSSDYTERTLGLSYGKSAWVSPRWGTLFAGTQLKSLSQSFSPGPESANAFDHGGAVGSADPVLSGKRSHSALGMDVGLLLRMPKRYSIGLSAANVNRPSAGFSATDKLPMRLRLGLSYKSLWMNLAAELRQEQQARGGSARDIVLAGERLFPSLDHGELGVRGSIGTGDADYREVTLGLSYKINKIRVDYSFVMPLGAVAGTMGSHRMGLNFLFGALSADEEASKDLMTQMQRLREQKGQDPYSPSELGKPAALESELLAEINRLIDRGEFLVAHQRLLRQMTDMPADSALVHLGRRLDIVASLFPDILNPQSFHQRALLAGCQAFVRGKDRSAMLHAAYAASLAPKDLKIAKLLAKLEAATLIEAEKAVKGFNLLQTKQLQSQEAFARKDYPTAIAEARDAYELEPSDMRTLKRIGSSLYMMGRFSEAIATWEAALRIETNPTERSSLEHFIQEAKKGKQPANGGARDPNKQAEAAAPYSPPARVPALDARATERLYQKGMEHYARGENVLAEAAFERILSADPDNVQARKALQRIRRPSQ